MDEFITRVSEIVGMDEEGTLPPVDEQSLRAYHAHLSSHLSFPVKCIFSEPSGPEEDKEYPLVITELLSPDDHPTLDGYMGLLCTGSEGGEEITISLGRVVEVKGDSENKQLISDYTRWFWEYR